MRQRALGSSPLPPLDAIGVDTTDHPVDKLLRGKASTQENDILNIVDGQLPTAIPYDPKDARRDGLIYDYLVNGPIIAWKCTKCGNTWDTLGQANNRCSDGSKHTME